MRAILVNVIERQTRIETVPGADLNAATQSSADFQSSSCNGKFCAAFAPESFIFARGVAGFIRVTQRWNVRRLRKLFEDISANESNHFASVDFVKDRVIRARKNLKP